MNTTNEEKKQDRKRIKVTMTDRAPISIVAEDWPVLAHGEDWNGEHKCQANTEWEIKVRRHEDGRHIVYGWKQAGNGGQFIGFEEVYVGWMLDAKATGDDVVEVINRVGEAIDNPSLAASVVADLPAEEVE